MLQIHRVIVAFSPAGRLLLSGGFANTLKLWNAEDGGFIRDFDEHQGRIRAISFAPDGRRFVSVGDDGTARLWDTDTGRLLVTTIARNGDWLSMTPEGLFATSGDPRDFIAIVKGVDVLPMDEFILRNRRDSPGLPADGPFFDPFLPRCRHIRPTRSSLAARERPQIRRSLAPRYLRRLGAQ